MSKQDDNSITRRDFVSDAGKVALDEGLRRVRLVREGAVGDNLPANGGVAAPVVVAVVA